MYSSRGTTYLHVPATMKFTKRTNEGVVCCSFLRGHSTANAGAASLRIPARLDGDEGAAIVDAGDVGTDMEETQAVNAPK